MRISLKNLKKGDVIPTPKNNSKFIFLKWLTLPKNDGKIRVKCNCGNTRDAYYKYVRSGDIIQCKQCIGEQISKTLTGKESYSKYRSIKVGTQLSSNNGELTDWRFLKYIQGTGSIRTSMFKVQCKCGYIKTVRTSNITNGKSKRCIKCSNKNRPKGRAKKESSSNQLYNSYKFNAEKRGYSFKINKSKFIEYTKKRCHYCNSEPTQEYKLYKPGSKELRNNPITYNGIDRKNNDIGYTYDNIVSCCGQCNRMKMNMNYKDFLNQINKIQKHLISAF